jgi:hypothetical protein
MWELKEIRKKIGKGRGQTRIPELLINYKTENRAF